MIVCGLLVRDDTVLMCHRRADREFFPDVWDFPGGHVEEGEAPRAALIRELREELGIEIPDPDEPRLARFVDQIQDLSIWRVDQWSGIVVNAAPEEHDDMRWIRSDEVASLELADPVYASLIAQALIPIDRSR